MACDAKALDEDPDTGAKKYRYVRTGENHFSMAFTYACLVLERRVITPCVVYSKSSIAQLAREQIREWKSMSGFGFRNDVTDQELIRRLQTPPAKKRDSLN